MATASGTGLRFDDLAPPSASLPALRTYVARDGAALPYREYPAHSERHLILIHGSGTHSQYLFTLANALSQAGAANVYTPDLRGHGVQPTRRGDIDYIDQLEDDLADLIVHITTAAPTGRCIVGGHSSGGGLAVRFAGSRYGNRAAAYLLIAPFLGHNAPTVRPNSGGWARPNVAAIAALGALNALGIRRFNGATTLRFDLPERYRNGLETLAYSFRLMAGFAPRDFRADLAAIEVPALVIVGRDDEAFVAQQFPPLVTQYARGAVTELVDGASHLGIVSNARAIESIGRWLANV